MEKDSTPLSEGKIADIIGTSLYDYKRNIMLPNSQLPGWEADLLIISEDRYAKEIEIKITKADFLKEFKIDELDKRDVNKIRKQLVFENKGSGSFVSNYCVAVPENLVPLALEHLPPYVGILTVFQCKTSSTFNPKYWKSKYIRKPKMLTNARKMTEREIQTLMRNCTRRLWDQRLKGRFGRA